MRLYECKFHSILSALAVPVPVIRPSKARSCAPAPHPRREDEAGALRGCRDVPELTKLDFNHVIPGCCTEVDVVNLTSVAQYAHPLSRPMPQTLDWGCNDTSARDMLDTVGYKYGDGKPYSGRHWQAK